MRALKIIGRTLSHILSVILCLLLTVAVLATMLVADLRVATNKNNLQNVLNEILSAPLHATLGPISASTSVSPDIPLTSIPNIPPEMIPEISPDASLSFDIESFLTGESSLTEIVVEYAFGALGDTEIPVEKEDIAAFVEESTLDEFISDKASSIVSDIVTGEDTLTLSGEEIKELLTENKELLEEHFDIEIPEEKIEEVVQAVEQIPVVQEIQKNGVSGLLNPSSSGGSSSGSTGGNTSGSTGGDSAAPEGGDAAGPEGGDALVPDGGSSNTPTPVPQNPIFEVLSIIRKISSDPVFFSCLGVCALLVALLFLLAWNKPYIAMFYSGSTFFTTGVIFLVPTLIAWLAPATWMGLCSNIPDYGVIIGVLGRIVLMLTGSVCGTVTGLGVVLFIGGIVVRILMKKRKNAKAAPAEKVSTSPVAASAEENTEAVEAAPAESAEATEATEVAEVADPIEAAEPAEAAETTNA